MPDHLVRRQSVQPTVANVGRHRSSSRFLRSSGGTRLGRQAAAACAAVAVVLALTPVAFASPTTFALGAPVLVSGPSPFAACTVGAADASSVNYLDTELEPFVAVNPTNPANIIGVFQQDRWNDGAAHATGAAASLDGGATWTRTYTPFSACAGGNPDYLRATDPWVSFDKAGRAYQIAQFVDNGNLTRSGQEVATSADGGLTWSAPVVLIDDHDPLHFNDKVSITGDPTRAGFAYATWLRGNIPGTDQSDSRLIHAFSFRGQPMISSTRDGGATWSTPVAMTNANVFAQGNQIAVLPDGTLLDIAATFQGSGIQPNDNHADYVVQRSQDAGRSWSRPVQIGTVDAALLTNPDIPDPTSLDETVRAGDFIPDVAVDPNDGTVYAVWASGRGTPWNHVVLVKSTDGGRHWSSPQTIGNTPAGTHSFNGTVEVAADGTVAVMFYDFRNNTPAPGLPTDVWLSHSHDHGATWSEQHVTGPFDMEAAPVSRGWFLGDYQGMAAAGKDLLLFIATSQGDSANVWAIRATQ